MGRPRKNRVSEYASLLAEELSFQLQRDLLSAVESLGAAQAAEIRNLKDEIKQLKRELTTLRKTLQKQGQRTDTKVGRWVPGGPGRPPKDADERIAAFKKRQTQDR